MAYSFRFGQPTIGVLPGWQFYRTATRFGYLKPVFNGISRAAQDLHCNLLFGCGMGISASPADPIRPAWPDPMPDVDYIPIGPANTDGLIVFNPLHSPARSQFIQNLRNSGYPVVFIGAGEPGSTVVADNSSGIFEAIDHLVEHGHRRIAFIAGSPDDMRGDTGERLTAYQSAMATHGLECEPELIVYGKHIYNGGFSAMRQILASGVPFSAVLASNDESAYGAMAALREAGYKIPQDIAMIGFDNRLEDATQDPPLSSVYIPLFRLGYHAIELMLNNLEGETEVNEIIKVNTRLIKRESCGCGQWKLFSDRDELAEVANEQPIQNNQAQHWRFVQAIANTILNQAQNISEDECQTLSFRLVESFNTSIDQNDGSAFLRALENVLLRTVTVEDDAHIWQDALSLLKVSFSKPPFTTIDRSILVEEMLDQARLLISIQMQRQHRYHIVEQNRSNSLLSLLTASLQTALDESQIYEILAQHLPKMKIPLALVVLFKAIDGNPIAGSVLRNALQPEQEPIHFISREFPPTGLFSNEQAFQLALIPLVNQTGQLGYVVFGTDHFDLYGAIVQQTAAAFNTARLYHQATEGRRLAEEANRIKSRFLSTISHELRTPLNLIMGLSGILQEESNEGKSPLPDSAFRDIERIYAYAQHLGGLIGDVLDLATNDAGQLHLNMELVDLSGALHMVAESGSQLTADKGLAWRSSLPESGPWVFGDATRLRQIVLNLVNNAIKFTNRGEVGLSLTENNGFVTVSVRDTGLGIPAEEQNVIFDEFRRSDRSVSLGYAGLGLGLAICKMLVEIQGGIIEVNSSGIEGEGSTFSFTLPVVSPPKETAKRPAIMPATEQTVLLLLAHSSSNDRLKELLNRNRLRVEQAWLETPSSWQSSLLNDPPDIILLDISKAPDDGWSMLKAVKDIQASKDIPVLFYASSPAGESILNFDYLTKPVELPEMRRALDQVGLIADPDHPVHTFLVVDDDPDTLDLHARIVQSQSSSNRVLKALNGLAALEIMKKDQVDLVLLDLQMPEMDGFGVLEAMRDSESTREIPVIVVTGKSLTEVEMARLNQGVAVVLKKGLFSMEETLGHIHAALERKRRLSLDAQRLVRLAMAYLHEHYAESISRWDIAQYAYISEDYLTYCFRQELGTTPMQYLQRFRVNQAKLLLRNSQKSITEIALEVGFTDSGYFSRVFHRQTGMSPEAFRRT